MSDEQVPPHFQAIRQQIKALQREDSATWQEIDALLELRSCTWKKGCQNQDSVDRKLLRSPTFERHR